MNILRYFFGVLLGYAVFVISAILLFKTSGINPHADPSLKIVMVTIIYGLLFSFLAGILTQSISKSGKLAINYILAGIIASFAAFSFLKTTGNHYSQFAAIFLFAPISVIGGLVYLRKIKKINKSI